MAGPKKTTTAAKRKPASKPAVKRKPAAAPAAKPKPSPAPKPADNLSVVELASGILSKEIRAGAVHVRRLAEAVVAAVSAKPKKGKKKDKGTKKLAKIPGQKAKK